MEPYQQPQPTAANDKNEGAHRGPLSRTWPQLFKKRRRYSPVRESAQQAQAPPAPSAITTDTASSISSIAASISQTSLSTPPPPKIPISRRSSSANGSVVGTPAASGNGRLFSVNGATSPITATPQADLLASKSNYELIASGQHLEMGLHFSTAMASGVMMKRATHRAAEQARRDRMKTAMVDLAEFLLDGEVTFGSGTTCFVVMRGGADGKDDVLEDDKSSKSKKSGETGEKKTVNKARLIEMALEKLKAQEKEIEMLRKDLENCSCRMDTTE